MEKIKYKVGVIVGKDETEKERIEIDESRMKRIVGKSPQFKIGESELFIAIRGDREFNEKALYLSEYYDWVLCMDHSDAICLIPLKKETK